MSSVRLRNKSNLGNLSISETYFSVLSLSFVFFSVKFNPFLLLILSTEMKCIFFCAASVDVDDDIHPLFFVWNIKIL